MKKIKSFLFVIVSFAALIAYLLYKEGWQSLRNLFYAIKPTWIIAALFSVVIANACSACVLTVLQKNYTNKKTYWQNLKNDFVANMLGVITPFASGNMAYQIAKMSKDFSIDAGDSSAVMFKKSIFHQGSLIFITAIVLLLRGSYFTINSILWIAILISLAGNTAIMFFYLLVPKADKFLTKVAYSVISFLGKIKIVKQVENKKEKAYESIQKLKSNMNAIKLSVSQRLLVLLASFVQQLMIYQTSFFVFKSFGLFGFDYLTVTSAQTLCNLIQNSIPIPGGLGVADYAFNNILRPIMGQYINYSMVIWRLITLYWPIIVGLLFSLESKKVLDK